MVQSVQRKPEHIFAPPAVSMEVREDGVIDLQSPQPLGLVDVRVGDWLVRWAKSRPDQPFLMEREGGRVDAPWRSLTYRRALDMVEWLAAWMLENRLGPDRPLVVLSDNSIDHALLSLAALHVGVPISSISTAYSLVSKDHAKLKSIIRQLDPGVIYVETLEPYVAALAAIRETFDGIVMVGHPQGSTHFSDAMVLFAEALKHKNPLSVAAAFDAVGPNTIAKVLFTSGSTGEPKGVITTQRMLTASQTAKAQVWPFVNMIPQVIVDWLPWSHCFGANHNFNLALRNGGMFVIDNGKPVAGKLDATLANLKAFSPTAYFNVPRGYDMLIPALRADKALRESFFRDLRVIFYAGAALPQHLWDALIDLSVQTVGEPVAIVSSWGSTETSPLASDCHFQAERSGNIGLPVPGVTFRLVPNGDKLEIRVKGPNVTPGYWRRPDLTKAAFDADGFYTMGDAVRLADAAHPEKGLYFDGRVAEDFKLMSGTWVSVGSLRVKALEALGAAAVDVVVTGHDKEHVGFLIFANPAGCRQIAKAGDDVSLPAVLNHPDVRYHVRKAMRKLKQAGGGSSTYATRAILMAEPHNVDAGEITDKGYTNQRAVLANRSALVEHMYVVPSYPDVLEI